MGKFNYSTTRNKTDNTYKIINKTVICQLTDNEIKQLEIRQKFLNDWEKDFCISIKKNGYKIVSEKQGSIINKIIKKYHG